MMDRDRLMDLFKSFKNTDSQKIADRDSKVMVIDGLNLFIRSFSGYPTMDYLGDHIGGLLGFNKSLFSLLKRFKPTRCIIVFDGIDGGRDRRKKFSEYKSGRKNRDRLNRFVEVDGVINESKSYRKQYDRLQHYLHVLPITTICIDYIEADDVIAHLVTNYYAKKDSEVIVISSDKDFLQLVSENTSVYSPIKKKLYDTSLIQEEFKLSPNNYLTYRTFAGDDSDNIPGVNGVGYKNLIKYFPEILERDVTPEDLVLIANNHISGGSKLKTYKKVSESTERLTLNWELMQLFDVDIPVTRKHQINQIVDKDVYKFDKAQFKKMVYDDGLHNHLQYFDFWVRSAVPQIDIYAK